MAEKGKGKVVNQWVTSEMDPTGESRAAKLPISLTIKDGLFHIPVAQHVVDFLGASPKWPSYVNENDNFWRHHDGEVVAATIDGVKGKHDLVMKHFQATVRNQNRRKVIIVEFDGDSSDREYYPRMNARGLAHMVQASHMRHGRAPSLSLNYSILWEMEGRLYRVYERHGSDDPPQMTYMRAAPDRTKPSSGRTTTFMLDWTEEREAFFRQMEEAMNKLIERIAIMLGGDLQETVDKMIAGGGGLLSLPAPDA
jgi:hypothetical protein